jgi:outer membrane PBP1 activator LpoA protein
LPTNGAARARTRRSWRTTARACPSWLQAASQADAVFLAVEPAEAARLKPALPPDLPVYATSQISTRSPDKQLAGVRFIDMPWFLMPQHPAVKRFARPRPR